MRLFSNQGNIGGVFVFVGQCDVWVVVVGKASKMRLLSCVFSCFIRELGKVVEQDKC